MFDKTIVHQSPRYPQTIHEHRAPTDASIALLNEMEKKMLDRIVESAVVQTIVGEFAYVVVNSTVRQGWQLLIRFTLNGQAFTADEEVSRQAVALQDHQAGAIDLFRRKLIEVVEDRLSKALVLR